MKILIVLTSLLSFSALADQCAYLTPTMAKRAKLLIQNGSELAFLCEPCGDTMPMAKIMTAGYVETKSAEYKNYQKVLVNERLIDLAYTYIKVAPRKYINVAKAIGCEAKQVSSIIWH